MATSWVQFLGPAFLVSLGYMDPVKWVTAVEGGCRFGFELLWVLVLSNFLAILLQYLSSTLGLVTGKNLAQICHDEYPQSVCFLLWLQCEISIVLLDITTVLGIAIGLNFLLGLSFIHCILVSAVVAAIFPICLPHLGVHRAEVFTTSVMGFVLLCFVLDGLYANATTSAALFGMLPRLKGESLYTALSIFGANITSTSFYLHSTIVQEKRKLQDSLIESPFRCNTMDTGLAFAAAFLVNFAVLASAAATFHSSGLVVITLQDAQALLEQILNNSVAPAAFMLALFCAGQFSSFTGSIAGQVALEGFVGVTVPALLHRFFIKTISILAALLLVWNSGSEGIYQILVFSQVILALLLPFAIVPLIKVTSSQVLMGDYKNSFFVEAFAWVYVALMSIMNIWLVLDMLFGETDEWMGSRSWNFIRDFGRSSTKWGEIVHVLVFSCIITVTALSTCLLMWMVSKPLKADGSKHVKPSDADECVTTLLMSDEQKVDECNCNNEEITEPFDDGICKTEQGNQNLTVENLAIEDQSDEIHAGDLEKRTCNKDEVSVCAHLGEFVSVVDGSTSLLEHIEKSEPAQQQTVFLFEDLSIADSVSTVKSSLCESALNVSPPESITGISCVATKAQAETPNVNDVDPTTFKETEAEIDIELLDKEDYEVDGWENLEQEDVVPDSLMSSFNSLTFEEPISGRSIGARSDTSEGSGCGCGSGSGSLSRLSGLGRAARRQYAAMLDEFWGRLFDLHGQPISQKGTKWQQEGVSSVKHMHTDRSHQGTLVKESFDKDAMHCSSKSLKKPWQKDTSGNQMDPHIRTNSHPTASTSSWLDHPSVSYNVSERQYSSLRFPSYREECDQQPATIHGYKSASYVGRCGNFSSGINGRPSYSEREFYSLPSATTEFRQAFSRGSAYKLPSVVDSSNMQLDKKQYYYPNQSSYLSSYQPSAGSLGRPSRTSFRTDWVSTHPERHEGSSEFSAHGTSSNVGRDGGTWNPLVYRATGELDLAEINLGTSHKIASTFGFSLPQPPIGRGGSCARALGDVEHLRSENERAPLSFDEISPSQSHKDGFSIQPSSRAENHSLWSRQPFEQLFGLSHASARNPHTSHWTGSDIRSVKRHQTTSSGLDREREVLNDMRSCIAKLLRLDGSDWLFRMDSGSDEDVIALIATRERVLLEAETLTSQRLNNISDPFWSADAGVLKGLPSSDNEAGSLGFHSYGVPHCGKGCVWGVELLVSFGVWCVHRILELSLMESRPELWGKYTYVLNRLQGILEPAFSKPRTVPPPCLCVQSELDSHGRCFNGEGNDDISSVVGGTLSNGSPSNSFHGFSHSWPWGRNTSASKGKGASASAFIEIIREVETAVSARKGRTGTAAGDVAFPKGKENLASVLKRYKRRLGNKPPGAPAGGNGGNRRTTPATSTLC